MGKLNQDLQQALINTDSRIQVIERGLGIGGLDPDKQSKIAVVPPRADIAVTGASGQATVSITNPEFIRGRGNPLRTPIYHRLRYSVDPTFRNGVKTLPPSVQTHWPLQLPVGQKFFIQVQHSYDAVNWTLPVVKGPVAT
jgi:hypothetical protein